MIITKLDHPLVSIWICGIFNDQISTETWRDPGSQSSNGLGSQIWRRDRGGSRISIKQSSITLTTGNYIYIYTYTYNIYIYTYIYIYIYIYVLYIILMWYYAILYYIIYLYYYIILYLYIVDQWKWRCKWHTRGTTWYVWSKLEE